MQSQCYTLHLTQNDDLTLEILDGVTTLNDVFAYTLSLDACAEESPFLVYSGMELPCNPSFLVVGAPADSTVASCCTQNYIPFCAMDAAESDAFLALPLPVIEGWNRSEDTYWNVAKAEADRLYEQ